jgi:putative endonuclease
MIHNHEVGGSCPPLATKTGMNSLSFPFLFYFYYMSHFLYILYSSTLYKYYIGSCADVKVRLVRHNAGATPSTKPGRPWILVHTEIFDSKTESLKRENYLKKLKSRIYIENLIKHHQLK